MKRALCLIYFTIVLISVLSGCGRRNTNVHASDGDDLGSFTMDKIYSFDEKYYAVCEDDINVTEQTGTDYVQVSVYFAESKELADTFLTERTRDFWGICFESNTYNIWVQSADVGIICFKYDAGQWIRDDSAERPADIVSKYDK